MYPRTVRALQADALFASVLQRSDEMTEGKVQQAIAASLHVYGRAGCAGRVAQEFGDHPEIATARMRWARAAVTALSASAA
jgi:hypothetical protein